MAVIDFKFPIKGLDTNWAFEKQPPLTSPYIKNVRPYDVQETRARGGQRPGIAKWSANQIATSARVNALAQISKSSATGDVPFATQLVAVGSMAATSAVVYYESSAGTMSVISASQDDLTKDAVTAIIPAFQKVFICDSSHFRVLDFINTKIATASISTNKPTFGCILSGDSSGAEMIVDYCNSDTAIYGYRTTSAMFSNSETISNAALSVSFVLNADGTAPSPPHWYNWTPFNENTTAYGEMPNNANIGCRYRARTVLAGNTEHPNQWYMSRQGKPYDFLYTANDAQSPVAGGNAEAGECPGIIMALIPYSDDYMVMGSDHEVWLMRGDPAAGGSIDNLTKADGIFGPNSWCFDSKGILYYAGTGGVYRVVLPGKPENISDIRIPTIFDSIGRSTHRVILTYDPIREGIHIFITTISDGTGGHYWYDLRTGGFFPEGYIAAQKPGPYSSIFYDADAYAYRGVIMGCKDGYLRTFDNDRANDQGASANSAISSYCLLGPLNLTGGQ